MSKETSSAEKELKELEKQKAVFNKSGGISKLFSVMGNAIGSGIRAVVGEKADTVLDFASKAGESIGIPAYVSPHDIAKAQEQSAAKAQETHVVTEVQKPPLAAAEAQEQSADKAQEPHVVAKIQEPPHAAAETQLLKVAEKGQKHAENREERAERLHVKRISEEREKKLLASSTQDSSRPAPHRQQKGKSSTPSM